MSRGDGEIEGLLPLDKPIGPTSHDMVARVRRELGIRRVGHTGTLDPLASGLLLVCVGRATRLAEYLGTFPKKYVARARLGVATSTDDLEGEATGRSEAWAELTEERIGEALREFEGESLQRPPSYSAKKVRGETAYKRARRGEEVALEPVPITVHEITLECFDLPEIEFRVSCSTGTYVRAIARDLGDRLGVGGHLVGLRRTGIGPFDVAAALTPEELSRPERIRSAWVTPLEAVAHLPRLDVSSEEAGRLRSGQALPLESGTGASEGGLVAVAFESRLVAVAEREGDRLRPRKVFPID